jgi:hypothetical protein
MRVGIAAKTKNKTRELTPGAVAKLIRLDVPVHVGIYSSEETVEIFIEGWQLEIPLL